MECEKAEVSFESTFDRRPSHAPGDAPGAGAKGHTGEHTFDRPPSHAPVHAPGAGARGHTRGHRSPLYGARPITTAGCAKSAHGCVTCVTLDAFVSKKRTQKRTRQRTRVRWTAFPVTGLKSAAPAPPSLPPCRHARRVLKKTPMRGTSVRGCVLWSGPVKPGPARLAHPAPAGTITHVTLTASTASRIGGAGTRAGRAFI